MTEETRFAPARRATSEEIDSQFALFLAADNVKDLLDTQSDLVGVINEERQFVLANETLLEMLGLTDMEEVLGRRPGEALGCIHAGELEGGCGTSESCRYCGAVGAVLECQRTGVKTTRDCRVTCASGDSKTTLDLRVTASKFRMGESDYVVLAIADIGSEQRMKALERIFFHDVINTASTLHLSISGLEEEILDLAEELPVLKRLSGSLLDDVIAQRDIKSAERGDLQVDVTPFDALSALEQVAEDLMGDRVASQREISIDSPSSTAIVHGDERLLRRTLYNMLKNALEALPAGGIAYTGVALTDGGVRYWVRNDTLMPREAQLCVFQRSYTTKGPGRGLGTYSMKLLGENYLKGKVWFEASEGATTFFFELPLGPATRGHDRTEMFEDEG